MVRPTVYGQLVIFLVFLPCLTFQGVEGKMFSPMVITLMLALASAFVLSLTFVPAMVAVLLRKKVAEKEVRIIAATKQRYRPWLSLPWRAQCRSLAPVLRRWRWRRRPSRLSDASSCRRSTSRT
jgi:Cu/Ag efflux pump CusA